MRVAIRPATVADGPMLMDANRAARALHAPYAAPFDTREGFEAWFAQVEAGRTIAYLALADGALAGAINLNEVVFGIFRSAYLGYHAYPDWAGQGVMTAALRLVVAEAFGPVGLHRLEANIQPGNLRSKALARRLGFRLEGFSPRYLYIDGAWRDHERWALLADLPGEG